MTETKKQNKRKKHKRLKLPFRKSHAFIIGINAYLYFPQLRTAVNDAKKIAEVLAEEQGFNVHSPLIDAEYKDIKQLLKSTIIKRVEKNDRVFFYFAGHGTPPDGEDREGGYIVPADAARGDKSKLLSMQELHDSITRLPCKHLLLVLDCCFAGSFRWSSRYRYGGAFMPKRIFKERFDRFVTDPAWQVITSSAYDQSALDVLQEKPIGKREDEEMLHSPFAEALFNGLQGAADIIPTDGGDGIITATELYLYIREQVEPVTIEKDEEIRQTPGMFPLEKHDKGEYIFLNPKHRLNLPPIPRRNPYKGLQSFEEADMDLFYGRERVIRDLMQKVDENNLIVVTGASGTGKSSVVKAGLIPGLRKKGYQILPVIRPGKTPSDALNKALNESKLFAYEVSLMNNINAISEKLTLEKSVLVIDQFEELVTQCKNEDKKDRFIEVLKNFLDRNKKNRLKIILTIRADFEPQFKDSVLEPYWQKARYTVPSFTTEELREIIVKPTVQEVFYIEPPELVDQIIDEVIQAPGALPLLSFTLSELYRLYIKSGRTDRVLHEDDYNELGGVIGALRTRADNIYYGLGNKHRDTMRKILLRMVALEGGELAGKKALMEDLNFSVEENKRVKTIIGKLLVARLILRDLDTDNQIYVEPAHDALIRAWATLWDWIKLHGEDKISLQNRMGDPVKDYTQTKDKRYLWYDNPWLEALRIESNAQNSWLNKNEKIFVQASIKRKEQKRRRFIAALVSIIIILSGLLIFAINKANEAKKEARIARANYYAAQAKIILNKEPATALRIAAAAYKLDPNNNVTQILSESAALTLKHPLYNVDLQHNYHVNSAVFSPCGTRILTASEDKSARLWDLKGRLLQDFKHQKAVSSVAFSSDGRLILTVSRDKSAKLWNLQGSLIRYFNHKKKVNSASFSPNGRTILTASDDNTARMWDLQGKLLRVFSHRSDVNVALFSPDGTRILTVCNDKSAWLLDLGGTPLKGLYGVNSAAFSQDGKSIVFVLSNNTVKLWNLEDNTEKTFKGSATPAHNQKYKNHFRIIHLAAVSPEGSRILIAYLGGAVELWNLDGRRLSSFRLHEDTLTSALFSPDGTSILTASKDSTAKLWDLNGSLIADLHLHNDSIISAAFSPDGACILTASKDYTAKLWDLKDQLLSEFTSKNDEMKLACFSPDGTKVLAVSNANTLWLWDLRGNLITNMIKHPLTVNSAMFSPDGTRILTASTDKTAKLWDLKGTIITDINRHTDNVNSAAFSPNGRFILTASYDDTAKLWDLQGNLRQTFKHQKGVISARFSPDGKKILTAAFDETAKLWDLQGNLLAVFKKQYGQVKIAIFSPDGSKVLTVSASTRLWDVNGKHLTELNILKHIDLKERMNIENSFNVTDAVFSPNSKFILTVHNDNKARLWDVEGKMITQFNHDAEIYSALFSPDGARVATASADEKVRLWDLQGNLLSDFGKHEGAVYSVVFSPDGRRILNASADKTVKLWYTPEGIMRWLDAAQIPPFIPNKSGIQNDEKKGGDKI